MSGKRKKVQRKSGWLTGIVIVSTGLIAGFQGFDIATGERQQGTSTLTSEDRSIGDRAIARRVSALDQLVTASLERNAAKNDRQGLADLIEAARQTPVAPSRVSENEFPVVNRALKGDREFVIRPAADRDITKRPVIAQASKVTPAPDQSPAAQSAQNHQASRSMAAQPRSISPAVTPAPFADGADIALFAADIPLPAALTLNKGYMSTRGQRSSANGSPLVPRKFNSGKAFGGLAEREFQKRERRCMTTALYFEARSEPEAGQIAVGQVVMNRVKSPDYPDTICGVVYQGSHRRTGCQFSFTCDGKVDKPNNKKQWERSKRLSNQVLEGQVWLQSIGPSTHYHATYVKPIWRHKMARLKQIGRHIFYKSPNISVTHTYQRYISGKRS